MKKLLVATSALVAAGSAAALEVTLGGEIEAVVSFSNDSWSQTAPVATLSVSAAGESMGWTYGGDFDIEAGGPNDASIYIGSDSLGKITMSDSCGNFVDMDDNSIDGESIQSIGNACLEITGASAAGWSLSAAIDVASTENSVIGVSGSFAGSSLSAEVQPNSQDFDVAVSSAIGGASIGVEVTGNLDDTDDFFYEASLDFSAMGLDFGTTLMEDGDIEVSTTIGNVTLKMDNDGGDFADNWSAEYESTLAEGLTVEAKITAESSLTITSTLEF